MRLASTLSAAVLLVAGLACAAEAPAAFATLRSRIEASDYRATGQLVRVDAQDNRTRYAIAVKGLWFQGAMHTLIEIVPPGSQARMDGSDMRLRILLEMRPDGRDSIRIFQPHRAAPESLASSRWGESLLGTVFSYEDLLDPQYFWPGQKSLGNAVQSGRNCEVLESTPGPMDRTRYSEVRTWLDRTIDYPIYAEKTIRQGGNVKEFRYYGLRRSSGVWSATQVEVRMRGRAGSAILIIKRGSAKAHLSVSDFQPEIISRFEERP
ncbi:MAG TPA: outer membrane lipoprotein-sorting protein [Terracidiphilus sp.]|nr:outer membrane lipoprotein-sorting protein [Terracidiphilus sp.]